MVRDYITKLFKRKNPDTHDTKKPNSKTKKSSPRKNRNNSLKLGNFILYAIFGFFLYTEIMGSIQNNRMTEISWLELSKTVLPYILKIDIYNKDIAKVFLKDDPLIPKYSLGFSSADDIERKVGLLNSWQQFPIYYKTDISYFDIILSLFPILILFYGLSYITQKQSGLLDSFSSIKGIELHHNIKTKLEDVIGMEEVKQEITEFIDFINNNEKYVNIGSKMPKGALFQGPPGTGKTLMARAIAGECGIPFISVSGSDFNEVFVGLGQSRIRKLFELARKQSPCIIFIDEIDAMGRSRKGNNSIGGHDDRENTLNRLLVEMDGFEQNEKIIIFAATNRADVLDSALLRPGRFDRKLTFNLPEKSERKDMFEYYLKKIKVEPEEVDEISTELSRASLGFTGADISNICNESSIIAVRENNEQIKLEHLRKAIDYVLLGPERRAVKVTPKENQIIAHHESGHAFMSYVLKHTTLPIKVSIVPRGKSALGFSQSEVPETKLNSKNQLLDTMCVMIGGRTAEKIFFDDITTGAHDDLKKINHIAYEYITTYGMDDDELQNMYYEENGGFTKKISDNTNDKIDIAIRELIKECYDKTFKIITDHKDLVEKMANMLLEKETLYTDDLKELFGEKLVDMY